MRVTSWKLVSDGSNQGRSGFQEQPYLGTEECGHANYATDYLVDTIRTQAAAGWQVMVHANGDAAIEQVVTAYERALDGLGPADLRHRIEHCSIPTDDHLARMARVGVSPSFLMNHVYFWGAAFRDTILGPVRAGRLHRVASAYAAGLRPSLHSDYDVTDIDPLLSARTAVRRTLEADGTVFRLDPSRTPTMYHCAIVSAGGMGRDPKVMAFTTDAGVTQFVVTEEQAPGVARSAWRNSYTSQSSPIAAIG